MPLKQMTCSRVVCGSKDLRPAVDEETLLPATVIEIVGIGPCFARLKVSKQWVGLHKIFDATIRHVMDPSILKPTQRISITTHRTDIHLLRGHLRQKFLPARLC